ncbi:hypothetical protein HDV57DRAFT_44500 [Trichoderma longibrachiatum]
MGGYRDVGSTTSGRRDQAVVLLHPYLGTLGMENHHRVTWISPQILSLEMHHLSCFFQLFQLPGYKTTRQAQPCMSAGMPVKHTGNLSGMTNSAGFPLWIILDHLLHRLSPQAIVQAQTKPTRRTCCCWSPAVWRSAAACAKRHHQQRREVNLR